MCLEGRPQRLNAIYTSYEGCLLSTQLITVDVDLNHLADLVVRFHHCKVTLSPPFPMHSPHWKSGDLCSISLWDE